MEIKIKFWTEETWEIFGWLLPNLAIIWQAMFTVEICYPRQIIVWIKPFVTAALHFVCVNRVSVIGQSCCQFSILISILVSGLNQKLVWIVQYFNSTSFQIVESTKVFDFPSEIFNTTSMPKRSKSHWKFCSKNPLQK